MSKKHMWNGRIVYRQHGNYGPAIKYIDDCLSYYEFDRYFNRSVRPHGEKHYAEGIVCRYSILKSGTLKITVHRESS